MATRASNPSPLSVCKVIHEPSRLKACVIAAPRRQTTGNISIATSYQTKLPRGFTSVARYSLTPWFLEKQEETTKAGIIADITLTATTVGV